MNKHVLLQNAFLLFVSLSTAGALSARSTGKKELLELEQIPALPAVTLPADDAAVTPAVVNDGTTDNTRTIQDDIDACAVHGGTVVITGGGTVLSAPLTLKSGVYLKIDRNTILKAVERTSYPLPVEKKAPYFIYAEGAKNTGIIGEGTIDGNGQDWWAFFRKSSGTDTRPYLIEFENCSNVLITGITIQNAPKFCVQPTLCTSVIIHDITITNPPDSPNTDGIDPSSSDTVFIDHCTISTGDDNIAIKSAHGICKNIYITNCTFGSGHGLSIGSETNTGVEHVLAAHCTFDGGDNGIRIKTARKRGGLVHDIQYSDMTMKNIRKYPFEVSGYYPENTIPQNGSEKKQAYVSESTPRIQDILVQNVTIEKSNNRGGLIMGLPESPIENLQLINVSYASTRPIIVRYAQVLAPKAENGTTFTPECLIQKKAVVTR